LNTDGWSRELKGKWKEKTSTVRLPIEETKLFLGLRETTLPKVGKNTNTQ
jgi:hypothetical protein